MCQPLLLKQCSTVASISILPQKKSRSLHCLQALESTSRTPHPSHRAATGPLQQINYTIRIHISLSFRLWDLVSTQRCWKDRASVSLTLVREVEACMHEIIGEKYWWRWWIEEGLKMAEEQAEERPSEAVYMKCVSMDKEKGWRDDEWGEKRPT
jgi:hypothetical protein